MSPQSQIESASMLTVLLFCHNKAEIHQLFQERACTNTVLVKL